MKKLLFASIILSIFSAGCLSDSKKMEPPQPVQTTAPMQTQPVGTTDPSANPQPGAQPVQQTVPSSQASVPAPVVNSGSSVKLNPAHGMPGHRCDISVGAPLDSKPSQPATNTAVNTSSTPTQVTPPPVVLPQATTKGLNPAHGQPGHRCDIAVGAPLDSKPTQ